MSARKRKVTTGRTIGWCGRRGMCMGGGSVGGLCAAERGRVLEDEREVGAGVGVGGEC